VLVALAVPLVTVAPVVTAARTARRVAHRVTVVTPVTAASAATVATAACPVALVVPVVRAAWRRSVVPLGRPPVAPPLVAQEPTALPGPPATTEPTPRRAVQPVVLTGALRLDRHQLA
jgi:hypothetical protein